MLSPFLFGVGEGTCLGLFGYVKSAVLDYWRFVTVSLRFCFSNEKQTLRQVTHRDVLGSPETSSGSHGALAKIR